MGMIFCDGLELLTHRNACCNAVVAVLLLPMMMMLCQVLWSWMTWCSSHHCQLTGSHTHSTGSTVPRQVR